MFEYSQDDSSREIIGNSRRIKENSFKFINEIEKNLGNLTLENIMKQLEEKGIHFSEEEMNKVTLKDIIDSFYKKVDQNQFEL